MLFNVLQCARGNLDILLTTFSCLQEKFSILDFVDKNVGHVEPVKPPPIESTPFKLVEEVMDLKELAAKLRGVTEFAVNFVSH